MFTVDSNTTDLKIRERGIYKMLFSMNIPQVATPELSVEDARCYIMFFREGSSLSAFIGLYLPRTDRRFYYTFSANPFPFEALSDVEDEARKFAEDMGFLLDEKSIGSMSPEERNRWFDEQAIFGHKKQPEEKPAAQPAPAAQASVEPKPVPQPEAPPAPAAPPAQPAAEAKPVSQSAEPPAQPAAEAPPQPLQPPKKKPAPARQAAQPKPQKAEAPQAEPFVAETEQPITAARPDDVIQQAVKAGVVKAPKPKLKKDIRSTAGVVNRDLEALARLLASF